MAYTTEIKQPQKGFRELRAEIYKPPENPEYLDEIDAKLVIMIIYFDESIDRRIKEIIKLMAPGWQLMMWWFPDDNIEEEF